MSHTTTVNDIVISDIDALRAAIAELSTKGIAISLEKGGVPRAYFPNQTGMGEADYVVKLTSCRYDIGLYKDNALKGYVARTDLFGGYVNSVLGVPMVPGVKPEQAAMGKLYNMYAVHAATRKAVKQGYSVKRVNATDGSVKLVVSGFK